jgi:hypothetical protein
VNGNGAFKAALRKIIQYILLYSGDEFLMFKRAPNISDVFN